VEKENPLLYAVLIIVVAIFVGWLLLMFVKAG
jgi:hypothetical protein